MPEKRRRFVLLGQQLLALGTVLAVTAPAATVVSLDIVAPSPDAGVEAAAALVASEPVAPDVSEVPVEGVEKAGLEALTPRAARRENAEGDLAALSAPERIEGYATVGVTWSPGERVEEQDITVSVRSLEDGAWSAWQPLEYHDDHGPDPDSAEARNARPGTDPIVVGDVDEVQVKIETPDGEAPEGTTLALVDPGETVQPRVEQPAIDTADLGAGTAALAPASSTTDPTLPEGSPTPEPGADEGTGQDGVLTALPAYVTPKPQIFSRAQWGADEGMRNKSALSYFEVHAGFVHHTVNANDYRADQVPALLRGIYAYHTRSRGWSDVGYNFLVDRFGRIWEGRYGGVDRPVVGAHTLNYNEYSFAMSAIGNFDTVDAPPAMIDAYGRLLAWKLSLHGVQASSPSQRVGSRTFPAINGHRDAGSTACPGRYLYAKLGQIRALAASYQKPFTARTRSTNLAGTRWPDLVVRNATTKQAFVVRTGGQVGFFAPQPAMAGWSDMDLVVAAGDLTGDGVPDMVGRNAVTKATGVFRGAPGGTFSMAPYTTRRFSMLDQLAGGVDLTGDGRLDLVGRAAGNKRLFLYPGNGRGGFLPRRLLAASWGSYNLTIGAGDMNGDGRHDLVTREGARLYLHLGTGDGLRPRRVIPGGWARYDRIAGGADLTGDRRPDLVVRTRATRKVSIFPGAGAGRLMRHPLGPFSGFESASFLSPNGNMAGNRATDLVARTPAGLVVSRHNGGSNVSAITSTGTSLAGTNLVLNVGDWNGDGHGDLMTRVGRTGVLQLRLGNGRGRFGAPVQAGTGWNAVNLVAAVGDITGDGYPDLMGQPRRQAMRIYAGDGKGGFQGSYVAHSAIASTGQAGLGLWNGDGSPDSLLRRSDGTLMLYPGNGPGGLLNPTKVGAGAARYDWLQAVGDANGDRRPDLLARERTTGILWLLPGTAAGFGARRFVAEGFGGYDLSSG